MQPYFMPYIGYFQLINCVDKFLIYDDVNFINRSWINRNQLLLNGKSSMFTVPLHKSSQNKLISEILVVNDDKWKKKMLKTVEMAYKKAPNFTEVFLLFKNILSSNFETITQLNFLSIQLICDYLFIGTTLELSSSSSNNQFLRGQNRILDICQTEKASHYINPIGGVKLYDRSHFHDYGIFVNYLKSNEIKYLQFDNEFVPNLSILDVLMFNCKEETKNLLTFFKLL
jgi:hypothetical protein